MQDASIINLEEGENESIIELKSTQGDQTVNNTMLNELQSKVEEDYEAEDSPIEDDSDDQLVKVRHDPEGSIHASDESDGLRSDINSDDSGEFLDGDSDLEDQIDEGQPGTTTEQPEVKKHKVYTLRVKPQQQQLFKNSLDENSIIYLPTGCGKTLVSILAMHYYFIKHGFEKKVVFLANTIQLVKQQAVAIKQHLPRITNNKSLIRYMNSRCAKPYQVEFNEDNVKDYVVCLHGEKSQQVGMTQRRLIETNIRDRRQLMNKIQNAKIVVMIAQMFLNCLRRGYTKLQDYVLVVFDECHHCQGDHPFGSIMREFYFEQKQKQEVKEQAEKEIEFKDRLPIIMGLTASPVSSVYFEPERLTKQISQLCINLDSNYVYYDYKKQNNDRQECQEISVIKIQEQDTSLDELLRFYESIQSYQSPLQASLEKMKTYFPLLFDLINEMNSVIINSERVLSQPVKDLFNELQKSLLLRAANVWLQLGKYSFYLVLEDLTSEFHNLRPKRDVDIKEQVDAILMKYLGKMRMESGQCIDRNMSRKFMKLFEIIKEEVQNGDRRILVFAFERRIVKYLQRVFNDFIEKMDPDEKRKLTSESVCGVSAARNMRRDNSFEHEYADPSDMNRQRNDARTRQLEYESDMRSRGGNLNETMNNSIVNEQQKYDNSKLARLMLQPQEKYDSQIEAIRGFRAKSIPILFTTSVTEEGFDIPHCNMVISFDRPQSLKSFIQIKGRAREAGSKYVIIVNSLEFEVMSRDKELYQATIERTQQLAIERLAKRVGNEQSGVPKKQYKRQETYKVATIKDSGAIINTNNSVEILKSYINTLRGTGEPGKKIFEYYAGTSVTGYICHLVLPGCALDVVSGDLQHTKRDAVRSAAFNAVKELRKLKQIREDLRPKNEAELTQERDLHKFNDLQLARTQEFRDIFKNFVRIQVNKEKQTERMFFHSLGSVDFDFPKINPEFAIAVDRRTFKTNPFFFQLYRISLTNVDPQIRDNKFNSGIKGLEVGILTCFRLEHVKEIFSGFRYELKKGSGQFYSLELVDEGVPLTQQQFERLWRIHTFMLCSSFNQEIRYFFNFLPHQSVSVPTWRTKINESKFNYELDQGRKFHPLFVLLQRDKKRFVIAEEQNEKLMAYEKVLGDIYVFHNKFKETNMKSKLPLSTTKYVEEQMTDFSSKYQDSYKNNYILQSITSDFLLNKVVVMAKEKDLGKDASNLKDRGIYDPKARSKTKGKQMDYHTKHEQLKKIFDHARSDFDCLITCNVLRKRLKQMSQDYFSKDDGLTKIEEDPTQFKFLSEFLKYPLDLETIFTILIAKDYVMPKVIDYTRAYYFRNCRLATIEKDGHAKAVHQMNTYTLKSTRNLIDKNYDKLTTVLLDHNVGWMKQLGRAMQRGFSSNYPWPLRGIQQQIENRKLDRIEPPTRICEEGPLHKKELVCEKININEVLRSITSRIYKSNKNENYEEYEFIGDCVLKLLATIEAFVEEPKHEEGELHLARARVISNSNLHAKSIKKQLFQFILTTPSEEPTPPFKFKPPSPQAETLEYKDTGIKIMDEVGAHQGYFYVPGKYHADVIEALVGIYYMRGSRRLEQCQFLLYSLDVLKYPSLRFNYNFEQVSQPRPFFLEIQKRLQHTFNNKNLIYQACTHSSFESVVTSCINRELAQLRSELERNASNLEDITRIYSEKYSNKVTSSKIEKHELFYERLEFLGDSVLDLVAVEYISEQHKNLDEGLYSLLKQASVSNRTLGLVALYWGLDEFIMIDSRESKDAFATIKMRFEHYYSTPEQIYTNELAPLKVLGDIFEACIGAVFLDSEFDYNYTRQICKRLMLPFIDHFTSDEMIKHYPQYKMIEYLKSNSFEGVRVVRNCNEPQINGEYEYLLMDKSNTIINKCREQTEKKAWDKLIETYQQQLSDQS